jgi:hypothetical protein
MMIATNGVGDFVPGWFSVPQNPVGGLSGFASAVFTVPQNPVGLGDFAPVSAMYVPAIQNSVLADARARGLAGVGCLCGGRGVGCGSNTKCGCNGHGGRGMGSLDTSSFTAFLSSVPSSLASGDMTAWIVVGGAAAVLLLIATGTRFGSDRSAYRDAMEEARQHYEDEVAQIRRKYPLTGYGRARRAARAAKGAF